MFLIVILCLKPMSVVFQVGANGVGLLDPGSEANNVSFETTELETYSFLLLAYHFSVYPS